MNTFDTLPEAVRKELQAMTESQISNLAHEVRIERYNAEQAEFPADLGAGIDGLKSVFCRDHQETIDDPVYHAINALLMLRLACVGAESGTSDLCEIDLAAMIYQIDSATNALNAHTAQMREIRTRLRQMTDPIQK